MVGVGERGHKDVVLPGRRQRSQQTEPSGCNLCAMEILYGFTAKVDVVSDFNKLDGLDEIAKESVCGLVLVVDVVGSSDYWEGKPKCGFFRFWGWEGKVMAK